ncbi:hypothetical protein R3P38DRAFT_2756460 [Favolaschia claudopus]|uniref:Uncharacterized protein n=1 Tax=Favolaschia claudopus TaxID=2862362 RepID=A0AAW0EHM2_9AGAR
MPSTQREYQFRRGTAAYTTGFIIPHATLEKISREACSEQHKARFGNDLVYALQWHVERFVYELMPMRDPKHPGCYFFGISFFPYSKARQGDSTYEKLSCLSEEAKANWYERYGKHSGIPLGGISADNRANFLPDEMYKVLCANKELWYLVEAVPTIQEVLAQLGVPVNARKIKS